MLVSINIDNIKRLMVREIMDESPPL